jgi:hypothetical protein
MTSLKLNMDKLDAERFFHGKSTYCDLVLYDHKDGKDEYGNDGVVRQSVSKEERLSGVKMPIVGNYKKIEFTEKQPAKKPKYQPKPKATDDEHEW